jgi:hypothetical protein
MTRIETKEFVFEGGYAVSEVGVHTVKVIAGFKNA